MRILYVEDNYLDADLLSREINRKAPEYEVVWAETYAQAITQLEKATPEQPYFDIVLTDMRLPDGSGISLVPYIQEHHLPIPVVVLTGMGSDEVAVTALKAGAIDYIVKRGDYLINLPTILETACQRFQAEIARLACPLHVLYAEQHTADIDLTTRHFARFAPHIHLDVVNWANDVLQWLPAQAGPADGRPCDVLLVDYQMPDMNGLELVKELLHVRKLDVPVIFVTGQGNEEIAMQALRLGAQDYIVKTENYLAKLPIVIENAYHRTQLGREKAALKASEDYFRSLIENISDVIIVLNEFGTTTFISSSMERILGYLPETVIGKQAATLVHPDDAKSVQEKIAKAFEDAGVTYLAEFRALHKDGGWRSLQAFGKAFTDRTGKRQLIINLSDITERLERERELESIAVVSAALRATPRREDMLPVIIDQLSGLLNTDGAALAQRDPVTGNTIIELARGEFSEGLKSKLEPGEGVTGYVISTGQTYLNNDAQSDKLFMRRPLLKNISALACVPLDAQGVKIGALLVGRKNPFTPGELRLLTAISDIAANALHRATLFEQTERRLHQLSGLRKIDAAISSSLDLHTTLNVLLDQTLDQLHVSAAAVLLLNNSLLTLEYIAGKGFRSNAIERSRLRIGEGVTGRAALERSLVAISNLSEQSMISPRSDLLRGEGFSAYHALPLVAKGQVKGILEVFHRYAFTADPEWLNILETLAGQAAIAIDNFELFQGLQRSNLELALAYDDTIEGWSRALDLRDRETEGHTQRVTETTIRLAQALGIGEAELVHVRRGALLHDIGKMGVPDSILLKAGSLTDEEWEIMRRHPQYAYDMLSPIAYLRPALDIPYCHHERWDGTGYPRLLKGEQIPLAARAFALVDVWDALLSNRPYRPAWTFEQTLAHIRAQSGKHFDSQVVEVFIKLLSV